MMGRLHATTALDTPEPVDINVVCQRYGINKIAGSVSDKAVFAYVVPKFGTIVILAAAIVAVSARSGLIIALRC